MPNCILIELYIGSASPARVSQELALAGVPIRSAGVRHLYVEVAAESPEAAMDLLWDAVPSRGMELSPVASERARTVQRPGPGW